MSEGIQVILLLAAIVAGCVAYVTRQRWGHIERASVAMNAVPMPHVREQEPHQDVMAWAPTVPRQAPPTLAAAVSALAREHAGRRYRFALGWCVVNGRLQCAGHDMLNIYHTLITGQTRAGKDNLALQILLSLSQQEPPDSLQLCIIDGKGLDFCTFEGRAHTWHLALQPEQIGAAMDALTQERQRRGELLRAARANKWRPDGDIPMLVVYISELSLLEDAVGSTALTSWLNSELAAGAAFGIRYIVATQTAANFSTRWRSQISLFMAGYQPGQHQDAPNTGATTQQMRAAPHGVPPSELRPAPAGAGVFTLVQADKILTLRTVHLHESELVALVESLPVASSAATAATTAPEGPRAPLPAATATEDTEPRTTAHSAPGGAAAACGAVAVSPEERKAILEANSALPGASRREVCRRVFNGATGGHHYRKVQAVLDEAGA